MSKFSVHCIFYGVEIKNNKKFRLLKNTTWKCEFYGLHENTILLPHIFFMILYIFYIDYQRSEWQLEVLLGIYSETSFSIWE